MEKNSPIFVAGQNSAIGKSLLNNLRRRHYKNVVNFNYSAPKLTNMRMVKKYFLKTKPEFVFILGGLSGGIKMNQNNPASLMMDNLESFVNIFKSAFETKVKKVFFLASSCVYPKHNRQPMSPKDLMSGVLEPTNSSYAMAKLSGIELCFAFRKEFGSNYISAIPTNTFGPYDNFNKDESHVIPALIRKIHYAKLKSEKKVSIWGTGLPIREFIYVDDLASACIFLMEYYNCEKPINIGTNYVVSIKELTYKIKNLIGFEGDLVFDESKPDGMPKKILNSEEIFSLGWAPKTCLERGLANTYNWFLSKIR